MAAEKLDDEPGPIALSQRAHSAMAELEQCLDRLAGSVREGGAVPTKSSLELAQNLYRVRRVREEILGRDLFGEPTWDILLDLYVMQQTGRECSVKSVCIASAAAPTTALRWFNLLLAKGVLSRMDDPRDGRRSIVKLTGKGLAAMSEIVSKL